jgi:PHD-zinc-finger like domain
VPAGDFICYRCKNLLATKCRISEARCRLCFGIEGALYQRDGSKEWVHFVCVNWILGIYQRGLQVCNFEKVLKRRGNHPKRVCNMCSSSYGITISCDELHCKEKFHATCAIKAGYIVALHRMKSVSTTNDENSIPVYCKKHMAMIKKNKHFHHKDHSRYHNEKHFKNKVHHSRDMRDTSNNSSSSKDNSSSISQNENSISSEESEVPKKRKHCDDYHFNTVSDLRNIRLDKSMRVVKNFYVATSTLKKLPKEFQVLIPHHSSFSSFKVRTAIQKVIKL